VIPFVWFDVYVSVHPSVRPQWFPDITRERISNFGTFWLKIEQFWPFEEIYIYGIFKLFLLRKVKRDRL
jgi:hypothetical protein